MGVITPKTDRSHANFESISDQMNLGLAAIAIESLSRGGGGMAGVIHDCSGSEGRRSTLYNELLELLDETRRVLTHVRMSDEERADAQGLLDEIEAVRLEIKLLKRTRASIPRNRSAQDWPDRAAKQEDTADLINGSAARLIPTSPWSLAISGVECV